MKNFYDATVIKPTLECQIKLTLDPVGQLPCWVRYNGRTIHENTIRSVEILEWSTPLTDPIDLQIQIYRNHPDAIKISMTIDDIDIIPAYQYLADPPTDYLDFNQIWCINIPNFYPWLHEVSGQGWIV